ncbi:formin Cdc12 [Schizosaccharomyces japonicus yFS275]|uniref:Formin Cdc12 n=1 Tax=Schizosaccharomyces japonicus (strain yFS275 / FY16936) TaxID=402676 RepID=B6JV74_SCHJY|nr:formin Cdc12 [Schizosaccharomyces japonicus yFS275]EEB05275.1 formin Cdc12 [Schizosaccharomyces japonicus yFS275]
MSENLRRPTLPPTRANNVPVGRNSSRRTLGPRGPKSAVSVPAISLTDQDTAASTEETAPLPHVDATTPARGGSRLVGATLETSRFHDVSKSTEPAASLAPPIRAPPHRRPLPGSKLPTASNGLPPPSDFPRDKDSGRSSVLHSLNRKPLPASRLPSPSTANTAVPNPPAHVTSARSTKLQHGPAHSLPTPPSHTNSKNPIPVNPSSSHPLPSVIPSHSPLRSGPLFPSNRRRFQSSVARLNTLPPIPDNLPLPPTPVIIPSTRPSSLEALQHLFNEFLKHPNFSLDEYAINLLQQFTPDEKWAFIKENDKTFEDIAFKEEGFPAARRPAAWFVLQLWNKTISNLQLITLTSLLRSQSERWILSFLTVGGFQALQSTFHYFNESAITQTQQAEIIKCFFILLEKRPMLAVTHAVVFRQAVQALVNPNMLTRKLAAELLSWACTLHERYVLDEVRTGFEELRKSSSSDEPLFMTWLECFSASINDKVQSASPISSPGGPSIKPSTTTIAFLEYCTSTLIFINNLCSCSDDLSEAFEIRNEFRKSGIHTIVSKLRGFSDRQLEEQLNIYEAEEDNNTSAVLFTDGDSHISDDSSILTTYSEITKDEVGKLLDSTAQTILRARGQKRDKIQLLRVVNSFLQSFLLNEKISELDFDSNLQHTFQTLVDRMYTDETARNALQEAKAARAMAEKLVIERDAMAAQAKLGAEELITKLKQELKEQNDVILAQKRSSDTMREEFNELKSIHIRQMQKSEIELRDIFLRLSQLKKDPHSTTNGVSILLNHLRQEIDKQKKDYIGESAYWSDGVTDPQLLDLRNQTEGIPVLPVVEEQGITVPKLRGHQTSMRRKPVSLMRGQYIGRSVSEGVSKIYSEGINDITAELNKIFENRTIGSRKRSVDSVDGSSSVQTSATKHRSCEDKLFITPSDVTSFVKSRPPRKDRTPSGGSASTTEEAVQAGKPAEPSPTVEASVPPCPPPPPPLPAYKDSGVFKTTTDDNSAAVTGIPPPPPPPPPAPVMSAGGKFSEQSTGSIPLPPPPPPQGLLGLPMRPRKKIKQMHWEKVEQGLEHTLWSKRNLDTKVISEAFKKAGILEEIEKSFSVKEGKVFTRKRSRKHEFMSSDLQQAFGIHLHKFNHKSPDEVLRIILHCDESVLQLSPFLGSESVLQQDRLKADLEPYRIDWLNGGEQINADKDASELSRWDYVYLRLVVDLNHYWPQRMVALNTKYAIDTNYDTLLRQVKTIDRTARHLRESSRLHDILEIILHIGNFMNDIPRQAKGYTISSLQRLPLMKNSTNTKSVLHIVEAFIRNHFPDLQKVTSEFATLSEAASINMESLEQECKQLIQGCRSVQLACDSGALSDPTVFHPDDRILSLILPWLEDGIKKMEFMKEHLNSMNTTLTSVMRFYGEKPNDISARATFFRKFSTFLSDYSKANTENLEQEREEKRQLMKRHVRNTEGRSAVIEAALSGKQTENHEAIDSLLDKLKHGVARRPRRRLNIKLPKAEPEDVSITEEKPEKEKEPRPEEKKLEHSVSVITPPVTTPPVTTPPVVEKEPQKEEKVKITVPVLRKTQSLKKPEVEHEAKPVDTLRNMRQSLRHPKTVKEITKKHQNHRRSLSDPLANLETQKKDTSADDVSMLSKDDTFVTTHEFSYMLTDAESEAKHTPVEAPKHHEPVSRKANQTPTPTDTPLKLTPVTRLSSHLKHLDIEQKSNASSSPFQNPGEFETSTPTDKKSAKPVFARPSFKALFEQHTNKYARTALSKHEFGKENLRSVLESSHANVQPKQPSLPEAPAASTAKPTTHSTLQSVPVANRKPTTHSTLQSAPVANRKPTPVHEHASSKPPPVTITGRYKEQPESALNGPFPTCLSLL